LLERPGQVISREELKQLIWPDKAFGDFDHAINLALAKLRATLGDSADVPHLIETLPRRGGRKTARKSSSIPPPEGFKVYGAFPLQEERHTRSPLQGMPMSPRSHVGGTVSLTGTLSCGTQFGGST
jgi:DNA-binding winged helix-turn-helix (wHTH) protein